MPSKTRMGALLAETLVGTALTRLHLPGLVPLPWSQTFLIFGYANDALKVGLMKWRGPAAVA